MSDAAGLSEPTQPQKGKPMVNKPENRGLISEGVRWEGWLMSHDNDSYMVAWASFPIVFTCFL